MDSTPDPPGAAADDEFDGLLRDGPDPHRPALSVAEAATELGMSRQGLILRVQRRTLDGFGVPTGQRIRWFVYEDQLAQTRSVQSLWEQLEAVQAKHRTLQAEVVTLRETLERRDRAYATLRRSDALLIESMTAMRTAFAELEDASSWQA